MQSPSLKAESRAVLGLAGPIFINNVAMGLLITVDTVMVGTLGAPALGSVALANAVSLLVVFFGVMCLAQPAAVLISRANGAGNEDEIRRVFANTLVAAVLSSVPMVLLLVGSQWLIPALTPADQVASALVEDATEYTRILAIGTPFGMLYTACTATLRGLGRVKPPMVVAVIGNVVNLLGNWALIFGNLGLPSVPSCAWATTLTRVAMFGCIVGYLASRPELRQLLPLRRLPRPDLGRLKSILQLGVPLGALILLERGTAGARGL